MGVWRREEEEVEEAEVPAVQLVGCFLPEGWSRECLCVCVCVCVCVCIPAEELRRTLIGGHFRTAT